MLDIKQQKVMNCWNLLKSKNDKTLMKVKNASARANQDLKELKEMLKQLDSTMENSVKWLRV